MMKNTDEQGNVMYSGYCMDLLEALSELMNFQYEIYEAPDGKYGRMSPNKTWDGMINELYENVRNTIMYLLTLGFLNISKNVFFCRELISVWELYQ